jgi:hypothetical protein
MAICYNTFAAGFGLSLTLCCAWDDEQRALFSVNM